MKMRLKWFVVPAVALGLGACKKEQPAAQGETPAAEQPGVLEKAADKVKEVVEEVAKPSVTPEQRSAKLGFAKHLPANTESVLSVHNATKTADRIKGLKFWKLVEDEMGEPAPEGAIEEAVPEPGAEIVQPPGEAPATEAPAADATPAPAVEEAVPAEEAAGFQHQDLWGSEVTIALGDTGGEQLATALHLYSRFGYYQMRTITKKLVAGAKADDGGMIEEAGAFDEKIIADLINDPESGVASFEKFILPPIYIAAKVDAAKREEAYQQISSSLGIVGSLGDVDPVEVERAGAKFTGYKLAGAKLAEGMTASRAEMEKNIEPDVVDRLIAAVAKKDVVLLSGVVGDYVVLFFGGSVDQLQLAASEKESLAGSEERLGFSDDFLEKDILAYTFGEKASLELLVDSAGGLSDTAKGIRDGLAGEAGLGDTREIESLLQVVIEREQGLKKFRNISDSGTVAFFEDGLKIESFGGVDQGAIDWKADSKLGHLGESSDVVFFLNFSANVEQAKASGEFIEALAETAYAISRKVAVLPGDNPDLAQFKQMSELFDAKFREDAVGIWQALSGDFSDGLGAESALVLDVKGTVPTIPGIPQAVVDKGKFPRVSILSPVTDRSKLTSSWEKINVSATSILAKVSELSGQEIPMQKPISSEKNDLTTWFFPMPFFNDDFMPSVTVNDKWFVASTSKLQALDLVASAEKGGDSKKGLVAKLNVVALQAYAKEMLKVIDENADAVFGEDVESYRNEREQIVKVIDGFDDYDSVTVHTGLKKDVMQTSIHFKTR